LAQQARWWEYLSHFNFTTRHVPGKLNKVADLLRPPNKFSFYFLACFEQFGAISIFIV
jgi:hypothetical protein